MTVSQIASLAATIRNTLGTQNAGVAAGVQNLLGATDNSGGNNGIPAVTDATSLQVEVASLRAASQNIVQAQSLLEAAGGGTTEIEDALNQLQQLSSEASSPDLTDSERVALNNQFQQIKSRIDQIATTAQFGGQKLLDGSLKTAGATDASGNPLAALDDTGLLGSGRTDLLSADDAQQAGQAVANAQKTVQAQQATIQQLQQGLSFAAATVESAAQNQDAAGSTLDESDLLGGPSDSTSAQEQLQTQTTLSLFAQTNKLPGNLVQLLNE